MLKEHLRGELCLRCYCLKNYNTALNVNVGPGDYARVLREIDNHFAMVLLVVDLTDFPCSIWPGLIDIIGKALLILISEYCIVLCIQVLTLTLCMHRYKTTSVSGWKQS